MSYKICIYRKDIDIMSQNSTFNIVIPEGFTIQFNQGDTFENSIGQFQPISSNLLCVIDGTMLHYYDKNGPFPTNIRFDYKQRRGILSEYYFRNIGDDTLYCVFGRELASRFYPRIDEVDPSGISELTKTSEKLSHCDRITKQDTLSHNPPNTKSNSIQQPNIKSLAGKNPTNDRSINQSSVSLATNHYIKQTNNRQTPLQSNITRIPPDNTKFPKHKRPIIEAINASVNSGILESRGTVTTRVMPNKLHIQERIPDTISIIDKGIKLMFPNPNYPIEIKTYHPPD